MRSDGTEVVLPGARVAHVGAAGKMTPCRRAIDQYGQVIGILLFGRAMPVLRRFSPGRYGR
jgi:hypothetical protein